MLSVFCYVNSSSKQWHVPGQQREAELSSFLTCWGHFFLKNVPTLNESGLGLHLPEIQSQYKPDHNIPLTMCSASIYPFYIN